MLVHGEELKMQLNTGAAVSVMSELTYSSVWNAEKAPPIEPSKVQLHVYTGDTIPVLGVVQAAVKTTTFINCERGWSYLAWQRLTHTTHFVY